jgi:hypothetical protein
LAIENHDLAEPFASYMIKCGKQIVARDTASKILAQDPVFDAVAATYIDVVRKCSPRTFRKKDIDLVRRTLKTSVEKSLTIRIAVIAFVAAFQPPSWAIKTIRKQSSPIAKAILIEKIFVGSVIPLIKARNLLVELCADQDDDLSRYVASVLITLLPQVQHPNLNHYNRSVKTMFFSVGLTPRKPIVSSVLDVFFKQKIGIYTAVNWAKALGSDRREAEARCLRVQKLSLGDPSTRITIVDTFNDLLLQNFCSVHPTLSPAYNKAAHKNHHPDLGAWLGQKDLDKVVPISAAWFRVVHTARVSADLAHAKTKQGVPTKPITHKQANAIMAQQKQAYAELLREWKKILR